MKHGNMGEIMNVTVDWNGLFAAIDGRDARAFADFLTPDARFRFGNAPVVAGRKEIVEAVEGFFGMISACRHRLLDSWEGRASVAGEGEVTYTVPGGATVTVPFVNVFELEGGLIATYKIYIDNGPLFAALAPKT